MSEYLNYRGKYTYLLVLLKGKEALDLDDEVEGWAGCDVEATVETIDFLTASTAAAPATEALELTFLAPMVTLGSRLMALGCAGVEQLWSWGKR